MSDIYIGVPPNGGHHLVHDFETMRVAFAVGVVGGKRGGSVRLSFADDCGVDIFVDADLMQEIRSVAATCTAEAAKWAQTRAVTPPHYGPMADPSQEAQASLAAYDDTVVRLVMHRIIKEGHAFQFFQAIERAVGQRLARAHEAGRRSLQSDFLKLVGLAGLA